MFKKLVHKWKYNNKFNAIELYGELDSFSYKVLKGSFKKDNFHIDDFRENVHPKTLTEKDKKPFTAFLNVNNNKVLNKIIDTIDVDNLDKLFPNFKLHDFFLQTSVDFNGKTVISLIRKKDLLNILEYLKDNDIHIIGVSLGVVTAPLLFQQFNHLPDTLYTDIFEFRFINGKLNAISKVKSNNNLAYNELDGVTSGQFNLYSLIVTANYLEDTLQLSECVELKSSTREFIWSRVVKTGITAGLILIFVTLLANFLIFDYYFKKQAKLEQNLRVQSADNEFYYKLKKELQSRIKFIKQQNLSDNTKASFYIDKLASGIPKSILLDKLEYFPLKRKVKENKEIQVYKNTIRLEGESVNKIGFVEWIESMKNITWVKKLDVVDYDRVNNNRMKFNILIKMNPANEQ